jgi:hypothetical protein
MGIGDSSKLSLGAGLRLAQGATPICKSNPSPPRLTQIHSVMPVTSNVSKVKNDENLQ